MDLEAQVLRRKWFYRFRLPSGRVTESYIPDDVGQIHETRLRMMFSVLDPLFGDAWTDVSCLDLACHEGYFSLHLAQRGCRHVTGIDAREAHVQSARLMCRLYGLENASFEVGNVSGLERSAVAPADVLLMFGLLYHLENPIETLRTARTLTRRVCIIETQVAPNITGITDWGCHQCNKRIHGSFSVIDEADELHDPEASVTGISLCPSEEALVWIMRRLGFSHVERVAVPPDGYEQLAVGKRVMVVGHVA